MIVALSLGSFAVAVAVAFVLRRGETGRNDSPALSSPARSRHDPHPELPWGAPRRSPLVAGPALRCVRACLLAAVAFAVGAVAHTSAGGLLPQPVAMVTLLVLGTVCVAPLLGRPASTRRVIGLLVTGQAMVHIVLTALAGHDRDHPSAGPRSPSPTPDLSSVLTFDGRRVGSFAEQMTGAAPSGGAQADLVVAHWVGHLLADLTDPNALMALAHAVAAAVVGWWLAAGERTLWRVLALSTQLLMAAVATLLHTALTNCVPVPAIRPGLPAREASVGTVRPWSLTRSVTRRGPPASLVG